MKRTGQMNHDQQSAYLSDFPTASGKNCTVMGDPNGFSNWRNVFTGEHCR